MNSPLVSLAIPTYNQASGPLQTADSPKLRSKCPARKKSCELRRGMSVEGIVQASELLCRSPRPAVIR